MAKVLRGGYTTGACAAAGTKAALLYLNGEKVSRVEVLALDGTRLDIPIASIREEGGSDTEQSVIVEVIKDAGDDPDITNGVSVFTKVRARVHGGIRFFAGTGIGRVTKAGLSVPAGEPSINPGPRTLIANMVREVAGEGASFDITISIPAGVELAKKTLNPILGIEGGISVIGTTGVLRPMSEEGFKNSLVPQIDVAKAAGFASVVLVPGKIGERAALSFGLPQGAIVQTSNFIGFMLDATVDRGIKQILLLGHIGKLAKVAAGSFYTHNRMADGRLETLAAYAAAEGLPQDMVRRILDATTTEEVIPMLESCGLGYVFTKIAERASIRAERYIFQGARVGTVMTTLKGDILGMDDMAKEIGAELAWNIKS